MSLLDRKILSWLHPIVDEADRPNRSAVNMKEIFDSNSNQLKDAVNGICDDCALAAEIIRKDETHPDRFLSEDGTYHHVEAGQSANGLPEGGNAGDLLFKHSSTDFDSEWSPLVIASQEIVTLDSAEWVDNEQTVNVDGMTSVAVVFVNPVTGDYDDYCNNGIHCIAQGTGTLTFKCDNVPANNVDVSVLRLLY